MRSAVAAAALGDAGAVSYLYVRLAEGVRAELLRRGFDDARATAAAVRAFAPANMLYVERVESLTEWLAGCAAAEQTAPHRAV